MLDGAEFGEEIVGIVRGFVERELTPLKAENESLKARVAALEAHPAPERGQDGEKGDPGENGADGAPGADGKDGRGVKDLLIDREGNLVATMDDGELKMLGSVVGKDGINGKDAEFTEQKTLQDEDELLIGATLRKELGSDLILLPDPLPLQSKITSPVHVTVENHLPKRGVEKTTVTKHDDRGRVLEYERREI